MKLNQKVLEQKIKAVNKIAKITKAMKIIATMRYQKLIKRFQIWDNLITDLQIVMAAFKFTNAKPFDKNLPELNILLTSDLGLCGSYNTNLFTFYRQQRQAKWIVIGKKGINHFQYLNIQTWFSLEQNHFNDWQKANTLFTKIIDLINNVPHKISIIYTHPYSLTDFKVRKITIWPVELIDDTLPSLINYKFTFEPNRTVILQHQLIFYLQIFTEACFMLAQLTEQATRQRMMESATENSKTMVTDLKLKYNQTRQEKITNEILEISQE